MEQIRIIKEMRRKNAEYGTTDVRPRYMVWENVPGAFSSNRGEDFRIVLEETAKVADENAVIPEPPKGKWTTSGCIMGDGWSIAWRVLDAQFWGVPQRRRRIALVADFGGQSAPEILFVRKGVSGHSEQSKPKGKATPSDASGSLGATDSEGATAYTLKIRGGCEGGGKGALIQTDKSATLSTLQDQTLFQPVQTVQCYSKSKRAQSTTDNETWVESETANTLNAFDIGDVRTTEAVVYALDRASFNQGKNAQFDFEVSDKGIYSPLVAKGPSAVAYVIENHPADSRVNIDNSGKVQTLTGRMGTGGGNVPMVMEAKANFIDVEMEVAVRKYDVNTNLLCECLRDNKAASGFSNKEIAEELNLPLTMVEHWFRTDSCFAIPEPDVWPKLKSLLGINTDEFDQSIMTFEYKGGTYDMRNRIHTGDTAPTLSCGCGNNLHLLPTDTVICLQGNGIDRADTAGCNGKGWREDVSYTLNTMDRPAVCYSVDQGGGKSACNVTEGQAPTLTCTHGGEPAVCYGKTHYTVRRLTPLECERLQGFPDGWTDIGDWTDTKGKIRKTSDAARYKALGNSIALPPWKWVLKRLCACYERDATMASLFDGIGGFDLIWTELNGTGSVLWASEIEDFPIAVTKERIR